MNATELIRCARVHYAATLLELGVPAGAFYGADYPEPKPQEVAVEKGTRWIRVEDGAAFVPFAAPPQWGSFPNSGPGWYAGDFVHERQPPMSGTIPLRPTLPREFFVGSDRYQWLIDQGMIQASGAVTDKYLETFGLDAEAVFYDATKSIR